MAMELNGVAFPAAIERKSKYLPEHPPLKGENGQGIPFTAGLYTVTLKYALLEPDQFDFFNDNVGEDGSGALLNDGTTKLYARNGVLESYPYCILHAPQFEHFNGNAYFGVTVTIKLPDPT